LAPERGESELELDLNILSLSLLALAAVSYGRRRFCVLWAAGVLFFPIAAWASVATYWDWCPLFTITLLALTLGTSLVALLLYAIDVVFAPFCVEMTYLTILCWLLCPLLVLVNFAGVLAV